MTTTRKRNLLSSRRRKEDEGEDDESAVLEQDDDSQSDGSELSENDADYSDFSGAEGSETQDQGSIQASTQSKPNGVSKRRRKRKTDERKAKPVTTTIVVDQPPPEPKFTQTADTDIMMNGLSKVGNGNEEEEESINFEDSAANPKSQREIAANTTGQVIGNSSDTAPKSAVSEGVEERPRRGLNPAIVPNRGGFFMHDQRTLPFHHSGPGPFPRGRGRGRWNPGNGYGSFNTIPQPSDVRWDHDLHDTVADAKPAEAPKPIVNRQEPATQPPPSIPITQASNLLSRSMPIGTVSVRVLLPGMQKPVNFEKMPVNQHTRLPDLRPPLRRDKPVRVAIPLHSARYIFPSPDRSFIFIPRAQRPNQQGGRGRGRGYISQYNSRRNSTYGGSVYTPSVAMSRRSSQAPDGMISPTGSTMSRPPMGAPTGPARPVVKLPSNAQHYDGMPPPGQLSRTYSTGAPTGMPGQAYPLPSQPAHENVASSIPMHQPRPQKTVSVASIESPGPIPFHAPQQQEQQPFHHQVPAQSNGQPASQEQQMYPHSRQMSFHSQPTGGTPLSHIPERAINAQPFQPMALPQQQFYPNFPMYYYPNPDGQQDQYNQGTAMAPPVYMAPPQQGGYLIPVLMPPQQGPPPPQHPENAAGQVQPGMFAHESNGMVYYYDPSQLMPNGEGMSPAHFSVPGPGGMITPAPDGYFYPSQNMMYYGPQ